MIGLLATLRETLPERRVAWATGSVQYVRDPPRTVGGGGSQWTLGFVLHGVKRHEGWVDRPSSKPIPLVPGMGWLVPPGAEVMARWSERCDYVDIALNRELLDGVDAGAVRPSLEVFDPVVIGLAHALLVSPARRDPLFVSSIGDAIMRHICRTHVQGWTDSPNENAGSRIGPVLEYIDTNLSASLDLSVLAKVAGRSGTGLRRLFAAKLGKTPHAYVLERRLDLAERLLKDTPLSVAEIATRSGFGTASYLTERLRLHRGCTPAALRRDA